MNFLTEGQDSMCDTLRTQWTVIPQTAPQPWIMCSGCGSLQPFQSSGKVRLNANGKKLDAWLVYKCKACGKTWNRTIFERRSIRDAGATILDAMQSNESEWVRIQEFDVSALRRKAHRIDEFADVDVRKMVLDEKTVNCAILEIELVVPQPASLRLDRLLILQLGISRTRLQAFRDAGKLRINPDSRNALRRPIKHGSMIVLDLSGEPDLQALRQGAV
jgi:hypothetical protein